MSTRRLTMLAAAGLMTLAACGEASEDKEPAGAELPAPAAESRSLDDVTSKLPAEWPAAEAMREAEAFPAHGSPWYPTPAPAASEDPCVDRPASGTYRC